MKHKKLITLVAAALSLTGIAAGTAISQPAAQASIKKNKKPAVKAFTFAKSWRGTWYSKYYLRPVPMVIHKTSLVAPWLGDKVNVVKSKAAASGTDIVVTKKKMRGSEWLVLTPANAKNNDDSYAFTSKVEKINGKKQRVIFEAHPEVGKVTAQYFKSKKLMKKYANHHFKNMIYSEISPR